MLEANKERISSLTTTAPSTVAGDAQQLDTVVLKVLQTGDITPFQKPTSLVNTAIGHMDSFCGVTPATSVSVMTSVPSSST
jgi:hypothetical protein